MSPSFLTTLIISVHLAKPNAATNDVQLQPNFNLTRFYGRWFELYRTDNISPEYENGSDIHEVYVPQSDGTIHVISNQYSQEKDEWKTYKGRATIIDPKQPAHWTVRFDDDDPEGEDYRVLHTDYQNLTVMYSEQEYPGEKEGETVLFKAAWISSRQQNVREELIEDAFNFLKQRVGLEKKQFVKTPKRKEPFAFY